MEGVIPIKAHQQSSFTLLRRPRPPKSLYTTPQTNSNARNGRAGTVTSPKKSSHYQRSTGSPYSNGSYTHYIDSHSKTDFPIHSLYPRGPKFFPPGRELVGPCTVPLFEDSTPIEIRIPQAMDSDNSIEAVSTHPIEASVVIVNYPEKNLHVEYDTHEEVYEDDYFQDGGDFTLDDFQLSAQVSPRRRVFCENNGKVISRQNYLKLTGWFATNVPTQENLNTVELSVGVQAPDERKPRHQALLELRSMVDEVLRLSSTDLSSITLGGDSEPVQSDQVVTQPSASDYAGKVFRSSTSRYFCGQGRSNSPFDSSDQPQISPSEEAILDCMMSGGRYLSLKAHFITELPDLSPLSRTITYLNISFNSLNVFPPGLFVLHHLVCLKMRNNPIKDIPNEIRNLSKLQVLCISFNLLTDLPAGLFDLQYLYELDVSYNTLHTLSRNISKLVNLQKLNVEGNQLAGLPSTSSTLPLSHLLVGDNLMHPILWKENTRNQPQELVDLCSMVIRKYLPDVDDSRIPTQVSNTMSQRNSSYCCDNCGQPMYGPGLRVIRAMSQDVFGIKNLPFIFQVCSPTCRVALKQITNAEWTRPFQTRRKGPSHSPRFHNSVAIT